MAITVILLILGAAILITGGEVFVRGATRLATLFHISPLVIGLTIVAASTSAPEMTVSLLGILGKTASSDIALGNVVGSNIANILLILGTASVIAPLTVSASMIKREIPFLLGITLLFWGICGITKSGGDEVTHLFPVWGGILFLILLVAYNVVILREVQKKGNATLVDEMTSQYGERKKGNPLLEGGLSFFFIAAGVAMLVYGSDMFVNQACVIARFFGVSELVISLTILALGTSLPELVVSIVSILRGSFDLAIGNVVGSNIFNLLSILGVSSIVAGGLTVTPVAFSYDIPIMVASSFVGLYFCVTDRKLSRTEGGLLLVAYCGYILFLVMRH